MKTIRLTALILFCAFLLAARGAAAVDYYVDSDYGKDSYDGLAPYSPWATLSKVNAFRFLPGDRVLFARGRQWRGSLQLQSGAEGAPIYYGGYGEGAKPKFLGSLPLNHESCWESAGENLWVCFEEAVPAFGKWDVGNIVIDGTRAAFKRWRKEDLKAQDDFWYDITGDKRIYYYSDENPGKKYDRLEAAVSKYVISHSGVSYAVVDGFDVRYGGSHGFGGGDVSHYMIRNCDISWIGGGDQGRGGGEGGRVRFGNGIEFWGQADDCLVENNRIWEIYDAALTNQGTGGNVESNITYRGNVIWNAEYSFEYWNGAGSQTKNILFENNRCYDAGFGWGHVQRPDPNGRCIMMYSNGAPTENFVVRGNTFSNATESLVRVDFTPENPDWPDRTLTLDGNRYFNDDGRLFFRWRNDQNYTGAQFDEFRAKTGKEEHGAAAPPEKTLEQIKD
ncbi:MAG: hypothetical protein K6E55_01600 [Thermoguttaceae bacterium]|nr:hypothetical protein [Thermoguttaceae bacterium]